MRPAHFFSRVAGFGILALGLASASFAYAQSPSAPDLPALVRQLQEQIKLLQAQVNDLKGQVKSAREDAATTREEVRSIREELNLTSTLRFGASGNEVKKVQEFLSQFPDVYPERLVTGFYGPRTEAAIRKFQARHGIEAIGVVGPKTLTKINELIRTNAASEQQEGPEAYFESQIRRRAEAETKKDVPGALAPPPDASGGPAATTADSATPPPSAATSTAASGASPPLLSPAPASPSNPAAAPALSTPSPTTSAAGADTAAPAISNIQATSTNPTTVIVTWNTNEPADSKIEYGLTTAYEQPSVSDAARTAAHTITLSGTFQGSTTYHYRAVSKDAAGNAATSADYTFTVVVPPPPDTTPPAISGFQAGNITETGATVSWTANEPATADFYYAPSSPINTSSAAKASGYYSPANFERTLTNLTPATTYYYIVSVKDAAGNTTTSSEQSFTTATPAAPPAPIGYWPFDGNGNNAVSGGAAAVAAGGAQFKTEGGRFGGYAYLPANGDSIKIPYSSIFDLANSFTIEFWFRQRSNQSTAQDLVYKGNPLNNYNFRIFRQLWNEYNFGPIITGYTAVNTGYWSQTSNPNQLSHGSWHHVAYTKGAAGSAYYLDGTLTHALDTTQYTEYAGPARTPAVNIIVGGSAIDTDIDNLRIYSSSLTAGQVVQNMQTASLRQKAADARLADISAALARIAEMLKRIGER